MSLTRSILGNSRRIRLYACEFTLYQTQRASYAQETQTETSSTETTEKESSKFDDAQVDSIRNISRLNPPHYRKQHGLPPFVEPVPSYDYHQTLKFKRELFGQYGTSSNVNPALCFPTKAEIEDTVEYERVYGDKSIIEMRDAALRTQAEIKAQYRIREEEVRKKLANIEEWKEKIRSKVAVKTEEASAAKQKRDRLLEEVRRFFGYTIDFKDEKFQIMLEVKEREMKKKSKLAQKKRKEEMLMKRLAALESSSDVKKE